MGKAPLQICAESKGLEPLSQGLQAWKSITRKLPVIKATTTNMVAQHASQHTQEHGQ